MWRMYSTKSIAWSVLGLSVIPLVLLLIFVAVVGWLQAQTQALSAAGQRSSDALLLVHRLQDDIGGASTASRLYLLNGDNASSITPPTIKNTEDERPKSDVSASMER